MTKNEDSTRFYSQKQESQVALIVNGVRQANSGAGHFNKGDVINKAASLLVECKCPMQPKNSFSIKKEWLEKTRQEAFASRVSNQCLAFNFEPGGTNYFVISEKLMKFLVQNLEATE